MYTSNHLHKFFFSTAYLEGVQIQQPELFVSVLKKRHSLFRPVVYDTGVKLLMPSQRLINLHYVLFESRTGAPRVPGREFDPIRSQR
jgi:hypothetical protein